MSSRLALALVFVLLLLAGCRGPAEARLGDRVTFDDSTWVVLEAKDLGATLAPNAASAAAGAPVRTATAGRFVAVEYEVESRVAREEAAADKPRLVDASGREIAAVDVEALYVPEHEASLGVEPLPPHGKRRFWTVFDADRGAGHKLVLRGLAVFGPKRLVSLGL